MRNWNVAVLGIAVTVLVMDGTPLASQRIFYHIP